MIEETTVAGPGDCRNLGGDTEKGNGETSRAAFLMQVSTFDIMAVELRLWEAHGVSE